MDYYLQEIKVSMKNGQYMAGLFLALAIPDICSSLESPNCTTNRRSYRDWFNKYIVPRDRNKYGENKNLEAQDLWNFRCSLFHNGRTNTTEKRTAKNRYKRILFIDPASPAFKSIGSINCCVVKPDNDDASLLINVVLFTEQLINGCQNWLADNQNNKIASDNLENMVRFHPNGVSPVFGPIIG